MRECRPPERSWLGSSGVPDTAIKSWFQAQAEPEILKPQGDFGWISTLANGEAHRRKGRRFEAEISRV